MSEDVPQMSKWEDLTENISLHAFAKQRMLREEYLRTENQVLILPQNTFLAEPFGEENLFPVTTKDVLFKLQKGELKAALYDDRRPQRELILKSADLVLPILFFVGTTAVSIGINLISNLIYDRLVKSKTAQLPSVHFEYVEIDHQGTIVRWRRVQAQADQLIRLLQLESQAIMNSSATHQAASLALENKEFVRDVSSDTYRRREAAAALEVANQLIQEAETLLTSKQIDLTEKLFRRSLAKLREACLWEPGHPSHRKYLHEIGLRVHDNFGCTLNFEEGVYWVNCPVRLSHTRGGFSIGGSGKVLCSVCGKDILTCPHVKGNKYDKVIARHHGEICNICTKAECEHQEGVSYNGVEAFGIAIDVNLDHIAFVENPSDPLAVIHKYSVTKSDLLEMVPEEEREQLVYGETVIHCHHCQICNGA